jgi:hypothetical protein
MDTTTLPIIIVVLVVVWWRRPAWPAALVLTIPRAPQQ